MPRFICELSTFLDDPKNYPEGVRKLVLHKCRKSEVLGEFRCYIPNGMIADDLAGELLKSFEEVHPALRNTLSAVLSNGCVYFKLNRPLMVGHTLHEVLSTHTQYGHSLLFGKKRIQVTVEDSSREDTPTLWRSRTVGQILRNALKSCGGTPDPSDADEIITVVVSDRNNRRSLETSDTVIFVGPVVCLNDSGGVTPLTLDDFMRVFSEELKSMGEHRLGEGEEFAENVGDVLTRASMTFALINGNISKRVTLKMNIDAIPFCKGAVFVLYNYCRMAHIIHKYRKLEESGSYPVLPDIDSVDFTLLSKQEEWDLMFDFVIYWPKIVESTVADVLQGDFKVHRILEFLKSLASTFSSYYRRTRILTEPRPNLLPVLQARIYLVLGLMKVYRHGLHLLDLQPIQNM